MIVLNIQNILPNYKSASRWEAFYFFKFFFYFFSSGFMEGPAESSRGTT